MPEPLPAPRWSLEGLHRLLMPGYGARANARDAIRELPHARQQAWRAAALALHEGEGDAARPLSWSGRSGAGAER